MKTDGASTHCKLSEDNNVHIVYMYEYIYICHMLANREDMNIKECECVYGRYERK